MPIQTPRINLGTRRSIPWAMHVRIAEETWCARWSAAGLTWVGSTMAQVIPHQSLSDRAQRLMNRRELHQDIGAITVFFHHLVQPANLPLNPPQPFEVRRLHVLVYANCFTLAHRASHGLNLPN